MIFFTRISRLLIGSLIGAGMSYYFDPRAGNHRRSLLKDRVRHDGRMLARTVRRTTFDFAHRLQGLIAEFRKSLDGSQRVVDDVVLVERVRSKIGRVVSHPRLIKIESDHGNLRLTGYALNKELMPLFNCVRRVRGVKRISAFNVAGLKDELQIDYTATALGNFSGLVH
jgi:hypothetical protein